MRTYTLKKQPGLPLYESLYRAIREDILTGALQPGEKLPSKRALASNLEVGKTTVEGAYNQLLEEGYISSRERSGYFVEAVEQRQAPRPASRYPFPGPEAPAGADLTDNGTGQFPFSVWIRLQREVILDYGQKLLLPMDSRGALEARQAIARSLSDFRGMDVDPENILLGAGTDFLYNLLLQLLGQDKVYAVEDPGYGNPEDLRRRRRNLPERPHGRIRHPAGLPGGCEGAASLPCPPLPHGSRHPAAPAQSPHRLGPKGGWFHH